MCGLLFCIDARLCMWVCVWVCVLISSCRMVKFNFVSAVSIFIESNQTDEETTKVCTLSRSSPAFCRAHKNARHLRKLCVGGMAALCADPSL